MSNKLSELQKNILYKEHTEKPFSSALCDEKRKGTYVCAGCNAPLFSSDQKFESGTGWPSFFDSLPDSFATKSDRSFFMVRTEYHCKKCGGHHGHIFDDGPSPTGKRFCNNGEVLKFLPSNDS